MRVNPSALPDPKRSRDAVKARTIGGWTPGLRELVDGELLPCGCLVGIYETWARQVVKIIDARGPACRHAANGII
jgi:hypothetical protein